MCMFVCVQESDRWGEGERKGDRQREGEGVGERETETRVRRKGRKEEAAGSLLNSGVIFLPLDMAPSLLRFSRVRECTEKGCLAPMWEVLRLEPSTLDPFWYSFVNPIMHQYLGVFVGAGVEMAVWGV